MCGIIGLHLRNPDLHPRLGELLTGMLCEMSDRGSDSAGVAVYGDPSWSPAGHAGVSVLQTSATTADVESTLTAHLGTAVSARDLGDTRLITAAVGAEALRAAYPQVALDGIAEANSKFHDVVIIDTAGRLGVDQELKSALARMRSTHGTATVLGMRDVLDTPSAVQAEWEKIGGADEVAAHYDAIWVYGDQNVYDPTATGEIPAGLAELTRFTGLLSRGRPDDDGAPVPPGTGAPWRRWVVRQRARWRASGPVIR